MSSTSLRWRDMWNAEQVRRNIIPHSAGDSAFGHRTGDALCWPLIGNEWEVRGRRGKVTEAGAASMMTLPELATAALEEVLRSYMRGRYGPSPPRLLHKEPPAPPP